MVAVLNMETGKWESESEGPCCPECGYQPFRNGFCKSCKRRTELKDHPERQQKAWQKLIRHGLRGKPRNG